MKTAKEIILWLEIPEEGIKITTEQQFNNKTYTEILKEVKEEEIATYDLLKRLRNTGKYDFLLKDLYVFVPNHDKISKKNNYVLRSVTYSYGAVFGCYWVNYSLRDASLGVFLIKKIEVKK